MVIVLTLVVTLVVMGNTLNSHPLVVLFDVLINFEVNQFKQSNSFNDLIRDESVTL